MTEWGSQGIRAGGLILFCAVLASLEALVPLFRYQRGRFRRSVPNLALAAGVLLTNLVLTSGTAALAGMVTAKGFGVMRSLAGRPWLMAALGIMALDFFGYLAHVLLHKMRWGWSFHRVHHSEIEVDVTTAFRQHPGETLWRQGWLWFGIVTLGLPLWVVAVYLSASSFNALLEHANVKMNPVLERLVRLLLVTPYMHKIHHSREMKETDSNYSNIFSFWDRLFRTYTAAKSVERLQYGLDGFDGKRSQSLAALLIEPFRAE
jgi:sterol desaturase/sphingolipid hydroxylase (fatty acid hydroxylase superfamily)